MTLSLELGDGPVNLGIDGELGNGMPLTRSDQGCRRGISS